MRKEKSLFLGIWIVFILFSCFIKNWALVTLLTQIGVMYLFIPSTLYSSKTAIISFALPIIAGSLDFLYPNFVLIQTKTVTLGLLTVLYMLLIRYYSLICPKIIFIIGVFFGFIQILAFMVIIFLISNNWTFILEGAVIGIAFIVEILLYQKKEANGIPFVRSKTAQNYKPITIDDHSKIQLFSDFSIAKLLCLFGIILVTILITFLFNNIYLNLGMISIFFYVTVLFRGDEVNYLLVIEDSIVLFIKYNKVRYSIESAESSLRYLNNRKIVILNQRKYTIYPYLNQISKNDWKEFFSITNRSNIE